MSRPSPINRADTQGAGESATAYMMGDIVRPPIEKHLPVEIVQHKEPREIKSCGPKRIWNPGVEVIVRVRRRIVSYQGRPLNKVIVIDILGIWICHILRSGFFGRTAAFHT
jgi:hypothetical protein